MASELKDEKLNESGSTQFGIGSSRSPMSGAWFNPSGRLGRWYSRFFASKAAPYVSQQGAPGATPMHPLAGDTVSNRDVITGAGFSVARGLRTPILPEGEMVRRNRYREFEMMDEYPEVGSAFDIFADDSCQLDTKHRRWIIKHENPLVIDAINELFDSGEIDKGLKYWLNRYNIK